MADHIVVETSAGPGWISLVRPANASAVLALTHGAGGGVGTADLYAVRDAVVAAGIAVALITQPYRVAGKATPPKPPVQEPPWLELIAALRRRRGFAKLPLVTGGRSNGARLACRTANDVQATGVVALAYPLHPPGRPDVSRLDELEQPAVPVLVVQGDRDTFGMPPAAPGRQVLVVPGADHALRKNVALVAEAVLTFVTELIRG
jgi:predicted alpha/beta-hydrolase family hydrolase